MRSVSPLAAATMAAGLSAALPWPMFSPADVQETPAAVNRSPRPASPGHWCDRPQPPAIKALCACDAFDRAALNAYAGSPFAVRAALMCASTASSTTSPVGLDGAAVVGSVVAGDSVVGAVVGATVAGGSVVGAVVGAA